MQRQYIYEWGKNLAEIDSSTSQSISVSVM